MKMVYNMTKEVKLKIINFKATLPKDFVKMISGNIMTMAWPLYFTAIIAKTKPKVAAIPAIKGIFLFKDLACFSFFPF